MTGTLAFIGNKIDRQSEKRSLQVMQEMRQKQPFYIVLNDNKVIYTKPNQRANLYLDEAMLEQFSIDWSDACLLGMEDDRPIIVLSMLDPIEDVDAPFHQIALRDVYLGGNFMPNQSGALAQAVSMVTWHKNNHFCARCGHESVMEAGGVRRKCFHCEAIHFPRTDAVVIMLVHFHDKCLLARSPHFEAKRYSCLAGFVDQGETLEVAVRRETREEMGVDVGQVSYIASQPWPFPHSLMLGCHAAALSDHYQVNYDEMDGGRWFSRDEARKMIEGLHPDGLHLPPEGAIAHYLVRQWLKS